MQPGDLHNLAAGPGAGDIIEILVGLAVFVIWVIASIAGAIKKRRGQAEPAESPDEPTIVFEPPPMPAPPPPPVRRKPKQRPPRVPAMASPEPAPPPGSVRFQSTPALAADRMTDANANRVSKTATSIRRLLRPDTIRSGVLLSELLQPPVSLRPPRELSQ